MLLALSSSLGTDSLGRYLGPGPEQGLPLGSPEVPSTSVPNPQLSWERSCGHTGLCPLALLLLSSACGLGSSLAHPVPSACWTLRSRNGEEEEGRGEGMDRASDPLKYSRFLSLALGSFTAALPAGAPGSRCFTSVCGRRLKGPSDHRHPGVTPQQMGNRAHSGSGQTWACNLAQTPDSWGASNMLCGSPRPQFSVYEIQLTVIANS